MTGEEKVLFAQQHEPLQIQKSKQDDKVLLSDRRAFGSATMTTVIAALFSTSAADAATSTPVLADTTTTAAPVPPFLPPLDTSANTIPPPTMDFSPSVPLTQFNTANDVPAEYFHEQRYIYAFVERVIDGDTIRVRHIPGYGFGIGAKPEPLDQQHRGIANVTLSVRVYGGKPLIFEFVLLVPS